VASAPTSELETLLPVIDLGRMAYAPAFDEQRQHHAEVLAMRDEAPDELGRLLLVEHHPPVITIGRRPGAAAHLTATAAQLEREGVEVVETDRGGDITYHGPGQLVAYPIIDLNRMGIGLHAYMRMLEEAVVLTCRDFGVEAGRDDGATGVWTPAGSKICAMGVRVRRWVTMHGLALNVATNLRHFDLIVPCGLAGRTVTSLERELGERCPSMDDVRARLVDRLREQVRANARRLTPG